MDLNSTENGFSNLGHRQCFRTDDFRRRFTANEIGGDWTGWLHSGNDGDRADGRCFLDGQWRLKNGRTWRGFRAVRREMDRRAW